VGWFLRFAHPFFLWFSSSPTQKAKPDRRKERWGQQKSSGLTRPPSNSSPSSSSIHIFLSLAEPPCFSTQLLFFDDSTVLRPARSSSLPVFSPAREKYIPKAPSLTRRPAAAEIRHEAVASNLPRLGRNYVAELLCRRGSAWNRTKGAQIGEFGREGPKGTLPTCLTKPRAASPAMVVARL
jgi:hypothetical protein